MSEAQLGKPIDWNIVIAGSWNVAILTPEGIASRLFGLDSGTPVEVQVAVDVRAPIRVKHEGILIQPSGSSLVITFEDANLIQLMKAVTIAQKALNNLPETPLSAAGLNLRYQFDKIPDSLINAGTSVIDDKLIDSDAIISEKAFKRQISWSNGVLNLDVVEREDSSGLLAFNFHKNSNLPDELSSWLGEYENMIKYTETIMKILLED